LIIVILLEYDYDDNDIECNIPLLDRAQLSATSQLQERGPENARLNGEFHSIYIAWHETNEEFA